jgi:hypothetical protein
MAARDFFADWAKRIARQPPAIANARTPARKQEVCQRGADNSLSACRRKKHKKIWNMGLRPFEQLTAEKECGA